ncbi:cytochrome c peroxidase [Xanthobacter sp. V4C-4]|uniref:cytochrome-c peroxidase n=1 Tax=Xanthobacter cornucopiae TaxID=3119924 RepID=UPI0037286558
MTVLPAAPSGGHVPAMRIGLDTGEPGTGTAAPRQVRPSGRGEGGAALLAAILASALLVAAPPGVRAQGGGDLSTPEKLGEALFFDTNLSKNRTQSCASCHSPDHAFTDPRQTPAAGGAVSLGDDGTSLGDRNAPTAAYAKFSPPFGRSSKPGLFQGGQFHDGRAADLAAQAGGPPLNPLEMGMPDKASVVARLKENPAYVSAFDTLYGAGVLNSPDAGYGAMTRAIAAFETTPVFAPFDSKYDRSLRGEAKLTEQEELGRVLFFSQQFTNCSLCHRLDQQGGAAGETFTSYEFHNIGVPQNAAARAAAGLKPGSRDLGLAQNPALKGKAKTAQAGRFKTPTLRNVGVTGPYMHNGVFKDLRTVILFYNTYNTKNPARHINPETGKPFDPPEVEQNISLTELETGPALDDKRIDALVAFLKTLTDRRYEHLQN